LSAPEPADACITPEAVALAGVAALVGEQPRDAGPAGDSYWAIAARATVFARPSISSKHGKTGG